MKVEGYRLMVEMRPTKKASKEEISGPPKPPQFLRRSSVTCGIKKVYTRIGDIYDNVKEKINMQLKTDEGEEKETPARNDWPGPWKLHSAEPEA